MFFIGMFVGLLLAFVVSIAGVILIPMLTECFNIH